MWRLDAQSVSIDHGLVLRLDSHGNRLKRLFLSILKALKSKHEKGYIHLRCVMAPLRECM